MHEPIAPREALPLWDQMTLFGPPFARHEPARPAQLDFDFGAWNAAVIQTADLLDALGKRRGPYHGRRGLPRLATILRPLTPEQRAQAVMIAKRTIELAKRRGWP